MTQVSEMTNLLGMTRTELAGFFTALGEKPFRATQVMKWIHHHGLEDFAAMTDISKPLRAKLSELAAIRGPEVVMVQEAQDGTHKWLLRLADGNCIETVYIPEPDRTTLCISTQVGCALDCAFCSTARQGFSRNLSAAEIIGQLWQVSRHLRPADSRDRAVSNVVLMGMGEPLLNFNNSVAAMEVMLDDLGYGLSRRRVTVSTSGVVPALDRLKARLPVSLAVSLHAPDDELRDQLVPLNRKYPLAALLGACRRYVAAQDMRMRVTFEYVMLDGVNDSDRHARALGKCLQGIPSKINLIPFNPFPGSGFARSSEERLERFRELLYRQGYTTLTRRPRGEDIDAACGQLVGQVQNRRPANQQRVWPVVPAVHDEAV